MAPPIAPRDPSLGFGHNQIRPIAPHDPSLGFDSVRNQFTAGRPTYRAEFGGRSRNNGDRNYWGRHHDRDGDHDRHRDWDHDGDRDRFRDRARSFQNWYFFSSPGWISYPYPYDMGQGFYDGSGYDNSAYDQNYQGSGYNDQPESYGGYTEPDGGDYGTQGEQPPPWPGPGSSAYVPENPPTNTGVSAAFAPPLEGGRLTVIFKDGRAPQKMQNYMVTAKALTDLDAGHYEQIPLDKIDIAATAHANRASGMELQVPGASRD